MNRNPNAEFTTFMVSVLEGKDDVSSAICIYRREDGTIGYRVYRQEVADTLGLLRFTALSVENDLLIAWRNEETA